MARVALISDVHLGTRQYGLHIRSLDFNAAFQHAVLNAVGGGVRAIIIGGDLFDSAKPDALSVAAAQGVIAYAKSAGVEVYGIDGNHDLANGDWLRVIGVKPLDGCEYEICGRRVLGVPYRNGRDLVATLQGLADAGAKADVLVAHFALHEMNGGGTADTGAQELSPILDKLGVRCVLMGHVHIPNCKSYNGIQFVNPGSVEMKSANEPREKYWFDVDFDTWEAKPVKIKTRRMVDVEIVSEEALAKFQRTLQEEASSRAEKAFYNVVADADMDEVFERLTQTVKETGAIARIVVCARRDRDVAPMVDRREGMATLEGAIEARFPPESREAKLVSDFLRSPSSEGIHLTVKKFMEEQQ